MIQRNAGGCVLRDYHGSGPHPLGTAQAEERPMTPMRNAAVRLAGAHPPPSRSARPRRARSVSAGGASPVRSRALAGVWTPADWRDTHGAACAARALVSISGQRCYYGSPLNQRGEP
jgi:hypothetical protein